MSIYKIQSASGSDIIQNSPLNTKRITVTTIVALLNLGAIAIGIMAIYSSLHGGLGTMSQLGWQGGVAFIAVGVFAIITTMIINLVQYYHSIKQAERKNKKNVSLDKSRFFKNVKETENKTDELKAQAQQETKRKADELRAQQEAKRKADELKSQEEALQEAYSERAKEAAERAQDQKIILIAESLTDEQILNFDFISILEDKERKLLFNTCFITTGDVASKAARLLPQLPLERIYELIPLFTKEHYALMYLIPDEYKIKFDFSIVPCFVGKHFFDFRSFLFDVFFNTSNGLKSEAARLLPQLPLERIYELVPLLKNTHYRMIPDGYKLNFDLKRLGSEIKMTQVFNIFYDTHGGAASEAARLLPQLSLERIYKLAPLFQDKHWPLIGYQHALNFDISKLKPSKLKFSNQAKIAEIIAAINVSV